MCLHVCVKNGGEREEEGTDSSDNPLHFTEQGGLTSGQ